MKIGKNNLIFPDMWELGRQGFFDMHNHFGPVINFSRCLYDLGTGQIIYFVGKTAAHSGIFLYKNRMSILPHHFDTPRGHGDSILFRFYLPQNPNNHPLISKILVKDH